MRPIFYFSIDKYAQSRYNGRMKLLPNVEQRRVVENLTDNILLFASAGTGKTFTIAHRVAQILASGVATAEQILCLTFTIKAANEMREDIKRIVGSAGDGVCVQTIHAFCYHLLREEERLRSSRFSNPQVIDEVDEEGILRSIYLERAVEWRLHDVLNQQNRKERVEWLKTQPLSACDGILGWRVEDGFIYPKIGFQPVHGASILGKPRKKCVVCYTEHDEEETECSVCGRELPNIEAFPQEALPVLMSKKKSAMMGIATLLKHGRLEYGLFTENPAEDYARAWEKVRIEKHGEYQRALSYYDYRNGKWGSGVAMDEQVAALLTYHAGDLMAEYERRLSDSNQLDFDDLIVRTSRYLAEEETLARYQRRFKFITVDEMQDTSLTEYALLKGLFAGNNVTLCGDFFQTIYAWRGSSPQEVLSSFQTEFTPTVYAFKENYRATKTLANASFGYLKNTYPQLVGAFCPEELSVHSEAEGERIVCCGFDNTYEEAAQIYSYIQKHRPQSPNDLCIMARSNNYIANLSNSFDRLNAQQKREEDKLRFFTVEKDHAFFKRACVKDILAVLKLLVNPTDAISMERIASKYVRGIGTESLAALRGKGGQGISVASFLNEDAISGKDPYQVLIECAKQGKIVVYDTETTGLDLAKDEMVQLSAVRLNEKGEIVATIDKMIVPTVPISQGAYDTHGFDMDYILSHGGTDAKSALEEFSAFVDGCVLVGHNSLRFDGPLIRRQCKEQGLPPLPIVGEYDTLTMSKTFLSGLPNHKLATLCARYGIVNEAAHNALGDITATAKALWKLLEECVVPTAEERIRTIEKYAPKFERFFAFYQELLDLLRRDKVGELVPAILQRMKLDKVYSAEGDKEAMRDVAATLQGEYVFDGESFLSSYLSDAALSGSQMDVLMAKLQKIPMITVHQAKGCEFNTVILAGVSERFFPSAPSKGTALEEEEKKVFYVAITRAKERLIMTRVTKDYKTGERIMASPYAFKIPAEYLNENNAW